MNYSNKKTVFLDRDGTINFDSGYVFEEEKFEFLPRAIDGLKEMIRMGYQLILITNQSGIARGYYSVSDHLKLTEYYTQFLKKHGVGFAGQYFCPHLSDAPISEFSKECECRKPKLGLFEKAIEEHNVDLKDCFCIGDNLRDLALCQKYPEVIGILISKDTVCEKFLNAENLFEAAQIIKKGRMSFVEKTEK